MMIVRLLAVLSICLSLHCANRRENGSSLDFSKFTSATKGPSALEVEAYERCKESICVDTRFSDLRSHIHAAESPETWGEYFGKILLPTKMGGVWYEFKKLQNEESLWLGSVREHVKSFKKEEFISLNSDEKLAVMLPVILEYSTHLTDVDLKKEYPDFFIHKQQEHFHFIEFSGVSEARGMLIANVNLKTIWEEIYLLRKYGRGFFRMYYSDLAESYEKELLLFEEIRKEFLSLPKDLRSVVFKTDYEKTVHKIRSKMKLPLEDLANFSLAVREISLYLKLRKYNIAAINFDEFLEIQLRNPKTTLALPTEESRNLQLNSLTNSLKFYSWVAEFITHEDVPTITKLAKENVKKLLHKIFSASYAQRIASSIDKVVIEPPPSWEDRIIQLNRSLKDKELILKKRVAKMAHDRLYRISEVMKGIGYYSKEKYTQLEYFTVEIIKDLEDLKQGDFVIQATNHIQATWMTFASQDPEAIFRHELGHIVDHALGNSSFSSSNDYATVQSIMQCINSLHPLAKTREDTRIHIPRIAYSSEDFADLIAFSSEKSQQGSRTLPNVGCFFMSMPPSISQTKSIFESLDSTHSSDAFRGLHQDFIRGNKMSAECTEYFDKFYPNFHLQKCMNTDSQPF
jgi:hypothetical protein